MDRKGILVVISGFAGSGKGTLMKRLLSDYDCYAFSVSMTTRNPRPGEVHGREYFFVTKEEFEQKIKENGLIEYTCYVENYYGTPRAYVEQQLAQGKNVILEIETQGALNIKENYSDAVLIYVLPPSVEELRRRLVNRGTEPPEVIEKRMRRAALESQEIRKYDYIVINDDIDTCVEELHQLIETAHHRTGRYEEFIQAIMKELST